MIGACLPYSLIMALLDRFRDAGAALSGWTERWIPDAWVICMFLSAVALSLAIFGAGAGVEEAVLAWGDGVWTLLELAMQFTIVDGGERSAHQKLKLRTRNQRIVMIYSVVQ